MYIDKHRDDIGLIWVYYGFNMGLIWIKHGLKLDDHGDNTGRLIEIPSGNST